MRCGGLLRAARLYTRAEDLEVPPVTARETPVAPVNQAVACSAAVESTPAINPSNVIFSDGSEGWKREFPALLHDICSGTQGVVVTTLAVSALNSAASLYG